MLTLEMADKQPDFQAFFLYTYILGILAGHYRNKQEAIGKERGKQDQGGTQTRVNLKGLLLNILLSVENE